VTFVVVALYKVRNNTVMIRQIIDIRLQCIGTFFLFLAVKELQLVHIGQFV